MIDTMGNKRCVDEDLPLAFPKEGYLIQILIRLPVVSLLRFKSVCPSWRSLIESPYFIDLHTATTFNSSSSKFGSFILHASVENHEPRGNRKIFENALLMLSSSDESEWLSRSVSGFGESRGGLCWSQLNPSWPPRKSDFGPDSDSSDSDSSDSDDYVDDGTDDQVFKVQGSLGSNDDDDDQLVLKLDNLGFPPCYELGDFFPKDIIGSCNGLVCLYHQIHNQFTLWNPATRQFRNLPKTISCRLPSCCLAGFCFDAETKDYKVVLFNSLMQERYYGKWGPYIPSECLCRVQVYSLNTDSWRILEGITCLPGYPFSKTLNQGKLLYLNGCFFFMAFFLYSAHQKCFPDNDRFMISFDLTKEIITPIQLPDHHRNDKLYLRYLGDKIALFTAPHVYDNDSNIYTYQDFQAETDSDSYEDSDDEGLEDQIDPHYTNYEVGDTGICNDESLKAEIDPVGDTGISKDECLKAEIDTDSDTGICNIEGLKDEIVPDRDTGICNDECLKGDAGICNNEGLKDEIVPDTDTGICNDECLKDEIVPDTDTGICNDECLKGDGDEDSDEDNDEDNDEDSYSSGTSVATDDMELYGYEDFNIWVLNEHSTSTSSMNKEYWKKLHSFRIELENLGDWNLPRGISNDGKFALLETKNTKGVDKRIKLYNLLDKEVKKNFLSCSEVMSDATAYKPSLVSIIGGNGAGAAATALKREIQSTVTMGDKLPRIWMQHWQHFCQQFPITIAAQSL